MKMNKTDYSKLEQAINNVINEHGLNELVKSYEQGNFSNNSTVQDLSKRFKWDLFYASGMRSSELSGDYNDEHIYTALRSIVPVKLARKY
jgi:site-specific recombinase XerD